MTDYLKKNHQSQMVDVLNEVLTNSYALYFKTHAYHWNVEGVHFDTLHKLFEDQYTEMWEAIDEIAERIRALGAYAPMNTVEILKNSQIQSADKPVDALDMVKDLADGHETLSKILASGIEKASEVGDEVSADIMIARQTVHDKTAWMLNATAK